MCFHFKWIKRDYLFLYFLLLNLKIDLKNY